MSGDEVSFRDFEHAGWEDPGVSSRYDRDLSGVTMQSIGALLDEAGVRAGTRLLDVATGAGYAADAAAQRGAAAVGLDFSAAQIELARRRHPGLRFEVADASALPFADDTFDAVVSSMGMLHFPDPDAAVREAFRVLVPGGRFAYTVWDAPDKTVPLGALLGAIRAHGLLDVRLPAGPAFFQFSEPRRSEQVLRDAGFHSPVVKQVPQRWRVATTDEVFDVLLNATVRMRATLLAQSAEALVKIRVALREALAVYRRDEGYELPMPAILAAGAKPAPR